MKHYFENGISLDGICQSTLRLFHENGFHGTSIRQIAAAAGLSVPGIYHHYPSKDAILETICRVAMGALLEEIDSVLARSEEPLERFDETVSCLLQFHAKFGDVAFVTYSEIRSLREEPRAAHIADRRRIQKLLDDVVNLGVSDGVFATPAPIHASRAITNICLGVAQWYRQDGELSIEDLVEIYGGICRDAAHCVS